MNKNKILFIGSVICTVGGAFAGGYFLGKIIEKKKADEEIDSVIKSFEDQYNSLLHANNELVERFNERPAVVQPDDLKSKVTEKPNLFDYAKQTEAYRNSDEPVQPSENEPTISVIPPVEFGVYEEYERISLTFTSDGYILDEDDSVMEDVSDIIGMDEEDVASHFGEYEDDSVFIRNNEREAYYEILRSDKALEDF